MYGSGGLIIFINLLFYLTRFAQAYVIDLERGPIEAFSDQDVTLQCSYTIELGDTEDLPHVEWFKGAAFDVGKSILYFPDNSNTTYYPNPDIFSSTKYTSTRISIDSDTTAVNLNISGVQRNDSSSYTCRIIYMPSGYWQHGVILLHVQELSAPASVNVIGDSRVLEGGSTTLTCKSDGLPTPTCTWKFQENDIPTPDIDSCQLNLTNLNRTDDGTYTCTAINSEGSRGAFFFLAILYGPDGPWPHCGAFPLGLSDRKEGDEVILFCSTFGGYPGPSLEWFRDSSLLDDSYTPSPFPDVWSQNSYYVTLQPSDNGVAFTCKGNHIAVSTEQECVLEPLDVSYSPSGDPQCSSSASGGGYIEGHDLTLMCRAAAGNPPADLTWRSSDGTTLSPSYNMMVAADNSTSHNHTLTLSREDNGKTYECLVSHPLYEGQDKTCHETLDVEFVPELPSGVAVTDVTDTELTVSWTEGEDWGLPQTFTVEYRESGSGTDWKTVDGVDEPPVTLTDLQPLTQYEIRVLSQNTVGKSDFSATITVSTTETPSYPQQSSSTAKTTFILIGVVIFLLLICIILLGICIICIRKSHFRGGDTIRCMSCKTQSK